MHQSHLHPEETRQIISKKGVPVEITPNPESEYFDNKGSLGVGGMMKLGTLNEPSSERETNLRNERNRIDQVIHEAVLAKLHVWDPSTTYANYLDNGRYEMWKKAQQEVQEELPELHRALEEATEAMKEEAKKRYTFGDRVSGTADIYVGKEGTLIYSLVSSNAAIKELTYISKYHDLVTDPGRLEAWDEAQPAAEARQARADEWRSRLEHAQHIADIHQVEVLPEFQGKGIAASLLDVAQWDIEQVKNIDFSIARIEYRNPDSEKMLALFKKAGYEVFFIERMFDVPSHHLVLRGNETQKLK
ncbi:MAG: hypothetical protein WC730_01640 [Patescibacteria group bacterium]|jgi:GNAT superfamily N-acetyltransferase